MKVLWILNSPFPEAIKLFDGGLSEKRGSGGWQMASALNLVQNSEIQLFVASPFHRVRDVTYLNGSEIIHILLPFCNKSEGWRQNWRKVRDKVQPDVIHIHGTEYLNGSYYIEACGPENVVVSVQGMVSVIARYYNCGLDRKQLIRYRSLYELIRKTDSISTQKSFVKRGEIEINTLRQVKHVIGRTSWDKVHVLNINPDICYHSCNETLRDEFYSDLWAYNNCIPHSIFLSQASYPVKGLHQFLKALPFISNRYPDLSVRIAGADFTSPKTYRDKIKSSDYSRLISSLINFYDLKSVIKFTGPLNAEQMKREYLNANVFVCPSTIENSPNSLGEAQILGVPCVASYVGGIPDFIPNINCGRLYRFEEYEMLSSIICDIFENSINFNNSEMRALAMSRHNREENAKRTVEIYKDIVQG